MPFEVRLVGTMNNLLDGVDTRHKKGNFERQHVGLDHITMPRRRWVFPSTFSLQACLVKLKFHRTDTDFRDAPILCNFVNVYTIIYYVQYTYTCTRAHP